MNIPTLWALLKATAFSLVFLVIVFVPMEKTFPAKKDQEIFRSGWVLDFCFFLGQYLFWSGVVLFTMDRFEGVLTGVFPSVFYEAVRSQPMVVQMIEVILLSDVLIYWGHRLQHNIPFLWRFHKVHHSAEHLDWLASHREHPLDSIYTIGLINLPAMVLGFPLTSIAGVIAFRGIWAIYIHSNVRLPLGPLKVLIGSPELHHWHHHIDRHAGNYANISPLMDVIFGTYSCPEHEPDQVGVREETPDTYLGQIIEPMVPRNWYKKANAIFRGKTTLKIGEMTEAERSSV